MNIFEKMLHGLFFFFASIAAVVLFVVSAGQGESERIDKRMFWTGTIGILAIAGGICAAVFGFVPMK